jgi:hypothetical protein
MRRTCQLRARGPPLAAQTRHVQERLVQTTREEVRVEHREHRARLFNPGVNESVIELGVVELMTVMSGLNGSMFCF